jgi:hypothetical protein
VSKLERVVLVPPVAENICEATALTVSGPNRPMALLLPLLKAAGDVRSWPGVVVAQVLLRVQTNARMLKLAIVVRLPVPKFPVMFDWAEKRFKVRRLKCWKNFYGVTKCADCWGGTGCGKIVLNLKGKKIKRLAESNSVCWVYRVVRIDNKEIGVFFIPYNDCPIFVSAAKVNGAASNRINCGKHLSLGLASRKGWG